MEKHAGFWLLAGLLLAVLNSARAEDKPSYFMIGGKLDLRPPVSERIDNILWKHNGNLLAEWVKDVVELTYYGNFLSRTTLEIKTGRLEILKMGEADLGVYTVEINSKVQDQRYVAKAIEEVPQPAVWIRPVACTPALEQCTLTCGGNTEKAEPVTYSWKMGDGEWKQLMKDINITKAETKNVETFSCRMKNPVSEKVSVPEDNPLFQKSVSEGLGSGAVAGLVVAVIIVIILIILGLAYWKSDVIRSRLRGRNNRPDNQSAVAMSEDEHKSDNNSAVENGQQQSPPEDSRQPAETAPLNPRP